MELSEPIKNVLHVNFKSRKELATTFLRFQEYYESPKFKGKIFTLSEYKKWYIKGHKKFTYYSDWDGFNFPSVTLKVFYEGKFNPLSEKEQELLELIIGYKHKKFYIIGTHKNDKSTLKHEMAHAFFYINKDYRREVMEILNTIDIKYIPDMLKQFYDEIYGYHSDSIIDEIQAYLIQDPSSFNVRGLTKYSKELNKIFRKYMKNEIK